MLSVINLGASARIRTPCRIRRRIGRRCATGSSPTGTTRISRCQYAGETESDAPQAGGPRRRADRAGEHASRKSRCSSYLDTNQSVMTVWPIYAFPYATSTQTVDQGQLKLLTSTILEPAGDVRSRPRPSSRRRGLGEQILAAARTATEQSLHLWRNGKRQPGGRQPDRSRRRVGAGDVAGQVGHQSQPQYPHATRQATTTADDMALAKVAAAARSTSSRRATKFQVPP